MSFLDLVLEDCSKTTFGYAYVEEVDHEHERSHMSMTKMFGHSIYLDKSNQIFSVSDYGEADKRSVNAWMRRQWI